MPLTEQILPEFILVATDFLHIEIISNSIIYLSLWSIIHFAVGLLLFYLVKKEKYPLLVVFLLLILFEVFEFIFSFIIPLISKESFLDTFFDVICGFIGSLVIYIILKVKK